MASTKKTKISKESIDFVNELKSIDELYRELDREQKKVEHEIDINKNTSIDKIFSSIEENYNEIEILNDIRKEKKYKLINDIHLKTKKYTIDYLNELEYEDLIIIYDLIINKKRNFFIKLLKFFNIIK